MSLTATPDVPEVQLDKTTLVHQELNSRTLSESDCVLILTHHRDFDYEQVVREANLVVDTRNVTRKHADLGKVYYL
ncbi:MAG: hypothetical protein QM758_24680 [Armatimonas sp.]